MNNYNKFSLISAGLILFDILFYIVLLVLDLKDIHFENLDGFMIVVFILPCLAFFIGVIALIKIKKTNEKGKSLVQLAMLPFVFIVVFTYLAYMGTRSGGKNTSSSNIIH